MAKFVLFKKQQSEISSPYSIIKDEQILKEIQEQHIDEIVIDIPYKEIYTKEDIDGYIVEASK